MSLPPAEERKLQRTKIDQLAHLEWLLERLIWTLAPGNLDFKVFQDIVLRRDYDHAVQVTGAKALPVREGASSSSRVRIENAAGGELAAKSETENYEDFTVSQVP